MANETPEQHRALIIDDEVDICYLLRGILRQKSIQADFVTSLAEAKTLLQEFDPPLIFLDNHLADGIGINYVRQLKKEHPLAKVVMITAHDTSTDKERAYKEGVDFFISKPFTRELILKTIDNLNFK